jgi:transcriptional regulator with XRE-family HTH domain
MGYYDAGMPSSLHGSRYQVFRKLLIEARESAGMTQVQVAELLQKPQSFISKYERGERRLDFTEFLEIATVLNIDVHAFIDDFRSSSNVSKRQVHGRK